MKSDSLPWISLAAQSVGVWWLALQVLLCCIPQCTAQGNQQNTSISLVDADPTQVVYSPFLCNSTTATTNPEACVGAWQPSLSDSGVPIVTSAGRNASTGNILPQIFFRFRASTVYLTMEPTTNATINVTVSANNITIMRTIQASLGIATIVNIPEEEITTLTITLLPASSPVLFSLISFVITTQLNPASTSIFPTQTLPTPTPVSTWFNPTTTSFATSTITMPAMARPGNRKRMIAQAVGLTVGLGLGLTAILVVAFFYWKKRRRLSRLWRRNTTRVEFD